MLRPSCNADNFCTCSTLLNPHCSGFCGIVHAGNAVRCHVAASGGRADYQRGLAHGVAATPGQTCYPAPAVHAYCCPLPIHQSCLSGTVCGYDPLLCLLLLPAGGLLAAPECTETRCIIASLPLSLLMWCHITSVHRNTPACIEVS